MIVCIRCGTKFDEYVTLCRCGEFHTVVDLPENIYYKMCENKRVKSAVELREHKVEGMIIPGFEFLGSVGKKYAMMVFGKAGSGKSTFCMKLGNVYANLLKKPTLYISGEEDFNTTFVKKIHTWGIDSPNFFASKSEIIPDIIEDIEEFRPHLLIIDSHTSLKFTWKDVSRFHDKISGPIFVILHVTKEGDYRGGTDLEHNVDINIEVEPGGKVVTHKNGFATLSNTYNVFHKEMNIEEQDEVFE